MTRVRKAGAHGLVAFIVSVAVSFISGCAPGERLSESPLRAGLPTSSFQILGGYRDRYDVGTDVVIVYFEDHTTRIEAQIESWRAKGYEPWVMFNSSQDYTGAYVTGKYDGGQHRDEIQRAADGSAFSVFDQGAYLVPNPNWTRYQEDFVKRAIDAGAGAIVAEEPEFFATAGYSPVFKHAWKDEYGTAWVDPNTNDVSRRMARRLMALLYQRHLGGLFQYSRSCDPTVKRLVAAHSPFDYAINPMVFPHAGVAALPEVDGYVAQVWSDTARSELTDPTLGGEDVEAAFHKAYLEYNYFWNLVRGTRKELIYLQDPKSDSAGFPWPTYRRWYEQTVVASALFDVASYEVMPWPDRFFGEKAPPDQQTSCLSVVRAMQELRKHRSDHATPYAMLVADSMLWEPEELEEVITGHMGIGVTLLRHGVPVDVVPMERVHEPGFLDSYRVIFTWSPQTESQRAALAGWVRKGGNLACLADTHPPDALFKELGVEIEGAGIETGLDTLVGDSHPLARKLGQRRTVPECESLLAYEVPSATPIFTTAKGGPAVAFEKSVDRGLLLFLGIPPESLARSRFGTDVIRSTTSYLSERAGVSYQESDRISIRRGPYEAACATRDEVVLEGPAIDLLDPELPLIARKPLVAGVVDEPGQPRDPARQVGARASARQRRAGHPDHRRRSIARSAGEDVARAYGRDAREVLLAVPQAHESGRPAVRDLRPLRPLARQRDRQAGRCHRSHRPHR